MSLFLQILAAVAVVLLGSPLVQALEPLTVYTASGRKFRGETDPRTSEQALWIRSGKPAAFVRRPIRWDRIVAVEVNDQRHSAEEFRRLTVSPEWQWAEDPFADDALPATPRVGVWEAPGDANAADMPDKVQGLQIDARMANWDSDVEVDGLVVHVSPIDGVGSTVPALGTLTVDLIGNGGTNLVSGNPFPVLGRWSQVVQPDDVGPGGAVFRLPFDRVHPDFHGNRNVGSYGMVHARLSVAGSGVFEDTAAFTRIRPYSPVRDRMQQLRGTRFHPWELTNYR